MSRAKLCVASLILIAIVFQAVPSVNAASCQSLLSLKLPDAKITSAESLAVGAPVTIAGTNGANQQVSGLPAFCRVAATLTPTADSDIKVEVWLPATNWNGKFQGVGNGGWSGNIVYMALAAALRQGYAAASTDTGHTGGSGAFALGHPEKLIDFGYRAVHEMTVKAKAIVLAYYGDGPKLSYWNGCSSGGKQGLKEAQKFPEDYDGIIAGAPANNWTHLMAGSVWVGQAVHKNEGSYIPPGKYSLIHEAVLKACDARDGVKDGVLENPTSCKFDPEVLKCQQGDSATCLTAGQVEATRQIYFPAVNPRTKQEIYPGLMLGSELGWGGLAGPQTFSVAADHFKYVVFKDTSWNPMTLNFDSDIALADKIDGGTINATDSNLKAFFARGGKLLQYHGWNDQLISPLNSINYYNSVIDVVGADKTNDSYRLFMVPGMNHCQGGDGPNAFDKVKPLEDWVEKGKTPEEIVASHSTNGIVDRTRPLCSYPKVAVYKGTGSTDEASNFVCK
jgi:feruloyl esterase